MGYYTYYTVEVLDSNGNPANENILKKMGSDLNKISDDYFYHLENEIINDMISNQSYKWYTHEENMLELSRLYPTYRFNLYGEGEERDDNWVEYFKNGRCVHRNGYIEYEPWNPKDLEWEED